MSNDEVARTERVPRSNLVLRVAIVAVLILAVAATLYAKRQKPVPTGTAAPAAVPEQSTPVSAALPKLVDLGAGKCIPCKAMAPILEELKKTYAGKMDVVFIDVWQNPTEADKYKINLIPTQIFFAPDGKELFRHEGFFSREDILAKWKEFGYAFQG